MTRIASTVKVGEIPSIVDDPRRGVVSLVGDHGGLSLITGGIQISNLIPGSLSFETEHGVVFLDPDQEVGISEELGRPLRLGHLVVVHDLLAGFLAKGFGWTAGEDADGQTALDELTRTVGAAVAEFLIGRGEPFALALSAPVTSQKDQG